MTDDKHATEPIDVQVDTRAFVRNIVWLKQFSAPARLCVVLKANAYGHGLSTLAPLAVKAGAEVLGLCTNDDARLVRDIGLDIPIMRLRMALADELSDAAQNLNVEEQVGSEAQAMLLSAIGQRQSKPISVHLNLDTGMGRSGFFVPKDIAVIQRVLDLPGLRVIGVMTHLAQADAKELTHACAQLDRFDAAIEALGHQLPDDVLIHSHNSAATLRLADRRRGMVRVGAACFGMRTSTSFDNPEEIQPVMSVRTRIAELREVPAGTTVGYGSRYVTRNRTRIAALPVGFGEGYPRALFNKGVVLIGGKRCPVIGRVSLDILTVDATALGDTVTRGDEAVLVGMQGSESLCFEELADRYGGVHTEMNLMFGSFNRVHYTPSRSNSNDEKTGSYRRNQLASDRGILPGHPIADG